MHLVYSQFENREVKSPKKMSSDNLTIPQINRHFLSLEARIIIIERYVFRSNQIEELRSGMIKIA